MTDGATFDRYISASRAGTNQPAATITYMYRVASYPPASGLRGSRSSRFAVLYTK